MIKAIETAYNGYKFRSRLEARWAVFFDLMEIKYLYEPEGFVLSNGEYYLPDFYLYDLKTYVEVKPISEKRIEVVSDGVEFPKELKKYAFAAETIVNSTDSFLIVFGDPYDAFYHLKDTNREGEARLFFCGECIYHAIARTVEDDIAFECESGEKCSECDHYFANCSEEVMFLWKLDDGFVWAIPSREVASENHRVLPFELILNVTSESKEKVISNKFLNVMEEFTQKLLKARQVRFEHGEKPII